MASRTWLFPNFCFAILSVGSTLRLVIRMAATYPRTISTCVSILGKKAVSPETLCVKQRNLFFCILQTNFRLYLIGQNWVISLFGPTTCQKPLTNGTHPGMEGDSQLHLRLHEGKLGACTKLILLGKKKGDMNAG